jgi:hypothetical protein
VNRCYLGTSEGNFEEPDFSGYIPAFIYKKRMALVDATPSGQKKNLSLILNLEHQYLWVTEL